MNNKVNQYLAMAGEVLVVIGAALWITQMPIALWMYTAGTVMFAIGRLADRTDYGDDKVVRRLCLQRNAGVVFLIVSAVLMHLPPGIYYVVYLGRQAWLLPFVIFVVFEVYTSWRLMALTGKKTK